MTNSLDPKPLEAAVAACIEIIGPPVGTPEFIAKHFDRLTKRRNDAAEAYARAAVTAYLNVTGDGWMPIETAPTNQGQLILGHSEQRWIRFGRFYPEFRKWYYSGTNERQQYSETEGGVPTHWRPLPAPPALAAQKKK